MSVSETSTLALAHVRLAMQAMKDYDDASHMVAVVPETSPFWKLPEVEQKAMLNLCGFRRAVKQPMRIPTT